MKILSIDTTAMLGSVAVLNDKRIIAQEEQGECGTHSRRLFKSIEHLLSLADWKFEDIEAIVVAVGPGSFTGLRIGLAAAKGMALAGGLPIRGVSSLESLALNGANFSGTVVPLIDARRGEIYAAAYRAGPNGKLSRVLKKCVLPPDKLIRKLKNIKGELLLVGDGAIEYGERISEAFGKRARVAFGSALLPQAANAAWLALPGLMSGRSDDIAALVPDYVRHSDAEIGFKGRGKHDKA